MTIFMVTHKQTWLLQQLRNVYYYETLVGNPTDAEWQDIVDEIEADYDDAYDLQMSTDWFFNGIDYRIVDTAGLNTFSKVPTGGSLQGGGIVDDTATQIALLVSVKGVTVKPNKVRTYLGGWVESSMANSLWDLSARLVAETFISNQGRLNNLGTNNLERVSVTWNSSHTQVVDFNTVFGGAIVASEVPATQRRRRIGVGI